MNVIIMLTVIGITILLCRYALAERNRAERQRKFMKNMNEFDSNRSKK